VDQKAGQREAADDEALRGEVEEKAGCEDDSEFVETGRDTPGEGHDDGEERALLHILDSILGSILDFIPGPILDFILNPDGSDFSTQPRGQEVEETGGAREG